MMQWNKTADNPPPEDVEVETMIADEQGVRNAQTLRYMRGLWFTPDKRMYVYYTPTHWRNIA